MELEERQVLGVAALSGGYINCDCRGYDSYSFPVFPGGSGLSG